MVEGYLLKPGRDGQSHGWTKILVSLNKGYDSGDNLCKSGDLLMATKLLP